MDILKINSPAKINLTLDVLWKNKNSRFHEIKTIFQQIDLCDEISLEESDKFILTCCNPKIPLGERNTVSKAVELIKKKFSIKKEIKIDIKKNIPPRFGLGGGSSNAAAVIKALNEMWKLSLNKVEMAELGGQIGMDVPFFIYGGTAFGTHFGEKIQVLPSLKPLFLILINQNIEIDTAWAYKELPLGSKMGKNLMLTNQLLDNLKRGQNFSIFPYLHNDFEVLINQHFPVIRRIKEKLHNKGVNHVSITGASTTLVCYFENEKNRNEVFEEIKGDFKWVRATAANC